MKKIFTVLTLGLVVMLVACNREVVFESVTIDGFTVEIETVIELSSTVFTPQGVAVENEYLTAPEVAELLANLEIELSEVERKEEEFIFVLVLAGDETVEIEELVIVGDGVATFEKLTFDYAGEFVYELILDGELIQVFTVMVTEQEETKTLLADVNVSELVVMVVYGVNISEKIQGVNQLAWAEQIALAYEYGYEYIATEDGEYERVAIYVPVPEIEEDSAVVDDTTASNNSSSNNNNSGNQSSNNTTNNTNNSTNNQNNNNQTNDSNSSQETGSAPVLGVCDNDAPSNETCIINALVAHGNSMGAVRDTVTRPPYIGYLLAFQSSMLGTGTNGFVIGEVRRRMNSQVDTVFNVRWENLSNGNFNIWLYR